MSAKLTGRETSTVVGETSSIGIGNGETWEGSGPSLFWKGPGIDVAPHSQEHIVLVNDQSSGLSALYCKESTVVYLNALLQIVWKTQIIFFLCIKW